MLRRNSHFAVAGRASLQVKPSVSGVASAAAAGRNSASGRERTSRYAGRISLPANPARRGAGPAHPCARSSRAETQRRRCGTLGYISRHFQEIPACAGMTKKKPREGGVSLCFGETLVSPSQVGLRYRLSRAFLASRAPQLQGGILRVAVSVPPGTRSVRAEFQRRRCGTLGFISRHFQEIPACAGMTKKKPREGGVSLCFGETLISPSQVGLRYRLSRAFLASRAPQLQGGILRVAVSVPPGTRSVRTEFQRRRCGAQQPETTSCRPFRPFRPYHRPYQA